MLDQFYPSAFVHTLGAILKIRAAKFTLHCAGISPPTKFTLVFPKIQVFWEQILEVMTKVPMFLLTNLFITSLLL